MSSPADPDVKKKTKKRKIVLDTVGTAVPAMKKARQMQPVGPVVTAPRFSPTEIERELQAEFQEEDEQAQVEAFLTALNDDADAQEARAKAPPPVAKNPEREALLAALKAPSSSSHGLLKGADMPPPGTTTVTVGRESTRQREAKKWKRGQATFTLKTERDCPDVWAGRSGGTTMEKGAGGGGGGSVKERTHAALKKGQSSWRTETAGGGWKTDEEFHMLRDNFD